MVWLVRALTPGPQKHSECLLIREIVEGISALRRLNSVAFKLFGLMFLWWDPFSCLLPDGGTNSETSAEEDSKQKVCSREPQEEEGVCGGFRKQVWNGAGREKQVIWSVRFLKGGCRPCPHIPDIPPGSWNTEPRIWSYRTKYSSWRNRICKQLFHIRLFSSLPLNTVSVFFLLHTWFLTGHLSRIMSDAWFSVGLWFHEAQKYKVSRRKRGSKTSCGRWHLIVDTILGWGWGAF